MQYGYFDNEKREYVIDNVALPCSWTNYLGVEDMAAFINHTAGGYLFYKTPEYHSQLSNDYRPYDKFSDNNNLVLTFNKEKRYTTNLYLPGNRF